MDPIFFLAPEFLQNRKSINISTKFHNSPQGEISHQLRETIRFLNRTEGADRKMIDFLMVKQTLLGSEQFEVHQLIHTV